MADIIYTLQVQPGIKRDGTEFESKEYTAGTWTRFQRGNPRKVGGYRTMGGDPVYGNIPRGMLSKGYNGVNYVFTGNQTGLTAYLTSTYEGLGSGPYNISVPNELVSLGIVSFPATNVVRLFGNQTATGSNLAPLGATLLNWSLSTKQDYSYTVQSTLSGFTYGYDAVTNVTTVPLAKVGSAPDITSASNPTMLATKVTFPNTADSYQWNFGINYSPTGSAYQILSHAAPNLVNIDNTTVGQVYAGNLVPSTSTGTYAWSFTGIRDTKGTNPTGAPISVDGGMCVLYPFIFVYGSNGYIANNHVDSLSATTTTVGEYAANNFFDWNGPTANQVNVSSGKILKGLPIRGGTNSPSGLFWSTNGLIRVSFTGQAPLYWSNDLISTDCTCMSGNSVVEQDGVYYWMGTDRFYLYNGTVQVLPNDKNVNWLFDNINFKYRSKVWGLSVKRYNEIWWFYPRGTVAVNENNRVQISADKLGININPDDVVSECNDVIIYNTKDKIWYDLGSAEGCRRSCGVPSEIFPFPIMAGSDYELITGRTYSVAQTTGVSSTTISVTGEAEENLPGSYFTLNPLDVTSPVSRVVSVTYNKPTNITTFTLDKPLSVDAVAVGAYIYQVIGGYPLYQHEFGVDKNYFGIITGVESSFETCDISFIGGDPSQDAAQGKNRRMKIFRIEQDFVQNGTMTLQFLTKPYASQDETPSKIYSFEPKDPKIDVREEFREGRLLFTSDTLNGDFQMGRIMIIAEPGDERA